MAQWVGDLYLTHTKYPKVNSRTIPKHWSGSSARAILDVASKQILMFNLYFAPIKSCEKIKINKKVVETQRKEKYKFKKRTFNILI